MDLSTMGAKLEEGMYKDRFAFQSDFRLMVSNAKLYNTPGSFVHNEAIALEIFFEKREVLRKTYTSSPLTNLQNGPLSTRLWKLQIKPTHLWSPNRHLESCRQYLKRSPRRLLPPPHQLHRHPDQLSNSKSVRKAKALIHLNPR